MTDERQTWTCDKCGESFPTLRVGQKRAPRFVQRHRRYCTGLSAPARESS